MTVELRNLGDNTLEGLPEVTPGEREVYDGVSEGHGGKDLTEHDISNVDRSAVSTRVGDGGVGVGSTVPLHGIGDGVTDVAFALLASGLVEKNVGLPDNLVGELDERNSPLANLSLELLVDCGGVGHVDRSASVLHNAALLVEADIESTEVLTPPVGGDNEDLLVIQVLFDSGVGTLRAGEISERSVGMTTDNEVETLGVLSEFLVLLITDVGHGDDPLGQLPFPNEVNGFLGSLGDVEEFGSGAGAGDSGGSLCGNADDGKVVLLEDLVGLDVLHEVGVVALDVGANGREGQVVQLELQVQ